MNRDTYLMAKYVLPAFLGYLILMVLFGLFVAIFKQNWDHWLDLILFFGNALGAMICIYPLSTALEFRSIKLLLMGIVGMNVNLIMMILFILEYF